MKLTEQQQNKIMWVVGGAFAIGVLYYIVAVIYLDPRAALVKSIAKELQTAKDNQTLKANAAKANVKWKELNIPTDANRMESDLHQTVNAAAGRNAGNFEIGRWNTTPERALTVPRTQDRPDTRTDFVELHFTVNTTTTTSHIGRFLNYLESIKMPARIDKIKISSKKSGQDDLGVDVYLSALVYAPKASATSSHPAPALVDEGATGADDTGFAPGAGGIIKPLDPPLPAGTDIAEQMKKRRQMQLAAPETPAAPLTTKPK